MRRYGARQQSRPGNQPGSFEEAPGARARRLAPLVAVVERFVEIDGATQAGLLSIQLFTTVIPIMIIGFAYFSGFAENASLGDLFIRSLGLHHPLDDRVREAFGASSGIRSVWTFFGVAAFLVWGIPMSIRVAGMFGRAWRRQPFGLTGEAGSGSHLVHPVPGHHGRTRADRRCLPAGSRGPRRALDRAARPSVDLLVADPGATRARRWSRVARPDARWLRRGRHRRDPPRHRHPRGFSDTARGWTGFGPIGVAMTLMTWCGFLAIGWVAIACAGAILWERNAPAEIVKSTRPPWVMTRSVAPRAARLSTSGS